MARTGNSRGTGTRNKTWGRELATGLLIFLCYLAYEGESEPELEALTLPFVTFAIYAFGSKFLKNNPDRISTMLGRNQPLDTYDHDPRESDIVHPDK